MAQIASRLRLTIDIGPLFETHWTGIPVFTRRLVQSLLRDGGIDLSFSFNLCAIEPARVAATIREGTGAFLREDFERGAPEERRLIDRTVPLLFPSAKSSYDIACREASTVHDMSTLFMPENHEEANVAYHLDHLSEELASNDVTFCVSDATAAALAMAYPSAARKTRTLYQYADWPPEFADIDRNLSGLGMGRYAVVVGTLEPRKNLALLINAMTLPELSGSSLRFIVIGRKGWKVEQFLEGLTSGQRERILFSGFVSEFTKYRLIKHSEFLVFPSLYEGFGIPALEAMSLGKPVLAARTSSFPEVIGDAGVYFDPLSPHDFAAAFAEIEDPRCIAKLAPKAESNSRAFDWQRMARPVLEWLREG